MPKKPAAGSEPQASTPVDHDKLLHMEIVYVPIDSIKPNDYNPNRQSEHEFELLCRSIEEDGFTQPILVNKDTHVIVDGEHRWRAMKALGYAEVPVCYSAMSLAQAKISTLRHNRARGSEDIQRAADVFRELAQEGATDWAKDSLMLDTTELNMMLDSIPNAELNLRTDNMDFEETQRTLNEERILEQIKREENERMMAKDNARYTVQFTFLAEEAQVVKAVVGKEHAPGILALCKRASELTDKGS